MPAFQLGPYQFTFSGASNFSGNPPTEVRGPDRSAYVTEHQVPALEGGVVEYVGSQQPTYQVKGFVAPSQDGPFNGTAAYILSGKGYLAVSADDARAFLQGLRGSGAQLLLIESTASMQSGYQQFYENGFFFITKQTFGMEAGRSYPYYPYALDLKGASPATYGNSSGVTTWPGLSLSGTGSRYLSGYYLQWGLLASQVNASVVVNTLGAYIQTVASGSLRLGIYDASTGGLLAQTAPQAVHSGWNYFPINPAFTTVSGRSYHLALMGTATSASGYTIASFDTLSPALMSIASGLAFSDGFPSTEPIFFGSTSGYSYDFVMVASR
jgi:hypothetical protein